MLESCRASTERLFCLILAARAESLPSGLSELLG